MRLFTVGEFDSRYVGKQPSLSNQQAGTFLSPFLQTNPMAENKPGGALDDLIGSLKSALAAVRAGSIKT
ncbi:MAG TPA: hypothetical protein VII92_05585, partial [Anaerolineae bacterium]